MHLRRSTAVTVIAGVVATAAAVSAVAPANAAAKADTAREAAVVRANVTGPAPRPATVKVPSPRSLAATTRNAGAQRSRTTSATLCYGGYMCFWYYSNYGGSKGGFGSNDNNFADYYFVGPGAGQGASMANNSESYYNYNTEKTAVVFTSPDYIGSWMQVPPLHGGNFDSTYGDNVESFYWS
jgi:hypothetical protein